MWASSEEVVRAAELTDALIREEFEGLSGWWCGVQEFVEHPLLQFAFGTAEGRAFLAVKYEIDPLDCERPPGGEGGEWSALHEVARSIPVGSFLRYCSEVGVEELIVTGHGAGGAVAALYAYAVAPLAHGSALSPPETPLQVSCITFGASHVLLGELYLKDHCPALPAVRLTSFVLADDPAPSVLGKLLIHGFPTEELGVDRARARELLRRLQGLAESSGAAAAPDDAQSGLESLSANLNRLLNDMWRGIFEAGSTQDSSGWPVSSVSGPEEPAGDMGSLRKWLSTLDEPSSGLRDVVLCAPGQITKGAADAAEVPCAAQRSMGLYRRCTTAALEPRRRTALEQDGSRTPRGIPELLPHVEGASGQTKDGTFSITVAGSNMELLYMFDLRGLASTDSVRPLSVEPHMSSRTEVFFKVFSEDGSLPTVTEPPSLENLQFFGKETAACDRVPVRLDADLVGAASAPEKASCAAVPVSSATELASDAADKVAGVVEVLGTAYLEAFDRAQSLAGADRQKFLNGSLALRSLCALECELLEREESQIIDFLARFSTPERDGADVSTAHDEVFRTLDLMSERIADPLSLLTKMDRIYGLVGVGLVTTALIAVNPIHGALKLAWLSKSYVLAGAGAGATSLTTGTALVKSWFRGKITYESHLRALIAAVGSEPAPAPASVDELEDLVHAHVHRSERVRREARQSAAAPEPEKANLIRRGHGSEYVMELLDATGADRYHKLTEGSKRQVAKLALMAMNMRSLRARTAPEYRQMDFWKEREARTKDLLPTCSPYRTDGLVGQMEPEGVMLP